MGGIPPAGISECATCGFRWKTGGHGGHSCVDELRRHLDVVNRLLVERDRLLRAIPQCQAHGPCVPHAIEWIERAKAAAVARPLADWDEDNYTVLWWRFPIEEPPYIGHPNCDDWPGYHTHWTPLVIPTAPMTEMGRA